MHRLSVVFNTNVSLSLLDFEQKLISWKLPQRNLFLPLHHESGMAWFNPWQLTASHWWLVWSNDVGVEGAWRIPVVIAARMIWYHQQISCCGIVKMFSLYQSQLCQLLKKASVIHHIYPVPSSSGKSNRQCVVGTWQYASKTSYHLEVPF